MNVSFPNNFGGMFSNNEYALMIADLRSPLYWSYAVGVIYQYYQPYFPGPGVNFINILWLHFALIFWCQQIAKPNLIGEKLLKWLLYKKLTHKLLMKLTLDDRLVSEMEFKDCWEIIEIVLSYLLFYHKTIMYYHTSNNLLIIMF